DRRRSVAGANCEFAVMDAFLRADPAAVDRALVLELGNDGLDCNRPGCRSRHRPSRQMGDEFWSWVPADQWRSDGGQERRDAIPISRCLWPCTAAMCLPTSPRCGAIAAETSLVDRFRADY